VDEWPAGSQGCDPGCAAPVNIADDRPWKNVRRTFSTASECPESEVRFDSRHDIPGLSGRESSDCSCHELPVQDTSDPALLNRAPGDPSYGVHLASSHLLAHFHPPLSNTDTMAPVISRLFVIALALAGSTRTRAAEPLATPHPVPWEFASDRYGVTVNGKPVSVFLASMNLHFASLDFTGQAEVEVTINENDYNRSDDKTYLKPDVSSGRAMPSFVRCREASGRRPMGARSSSPSPSPDNTRSKDQARATLRTRSCFFLPIHRRKTSRRVTTRRSSGSGPARISGQWISSVGRRCISRPERCSISPWKKSSGRFSADEKRRLSRGACSRDRIRAIEQAGCPQPVSRLPAG